MRITKSNGTDTRRFMRSLALAFGKVAANNSGRTYNASFSLELAAPLVNKTDSEIKSYLDKVTKAIQQFSETDLLNVTFDLAEHGGVDFQLGNETKEAYEASKKLETPSNEVPQGAE